VSFAVVVCSTIVSVSNSPTVASPIEYLVFDRRTSNERAFRERQHKGVSAILGQINVIRVIQAMFLLSKGEVTASVFDEIALLNSGVELVSSALVMLSHGSLLETLVLLRTALETGCASLLIHRDEQEREKYYSAGGEPFRSQRAIGEAKREIACVGKLYGILSDVSVHVDKRVHGSRIVAIEDDGTTRISIGPYDSSLSVKDEAALLHLLLLMTFILERLLELVTVEERGSVLRFEHREYQCISCSHSSIERLYSEFLDMCSNAA